MAAQFPETVYYLVMAMALLEFLCAILKLAKTGIVFLILRILSCFAGIVYIALLVKRPPLFGPFEALIYIVLVMGLLALVFYRKHGSSNVFFLINTLCVLAIILLQTGRPMALNDDYYMYGNVWVIVFFNFRLVAAAFLVHAAGLHLAGLVFTKKPEEMLAFGARNTLLAGACVYLASEWAGSLWCLNWFGDSWQWSRGFFKASVLFLLVMAACHLPVVIARNRFGRGIMGTLPGIFILWMIFYH